MTPEQRQAALERCEKAPLPPWDVEVQYPNSRENSFPAVTDSEGRILFDAANADYRLGNAQGYDADEDGVSYWFQGPSVDAMEFACYARADLPAALAHIAELEAENARLRAALQQYADEKNWSNHPGDIFREWLPDGDAPEIARAALKDGE